MAARLRAAGVLGDATLLALQATPLGNGMVGTSIRYALTYEGDAGQAPASVVGKFPALDTTSRQSGAAMLLYLRETSFYREVAPKVGIRTPRVLANLFDPATHDFVLLFEDLTPARGGDQLFGCSVEDAALAMREIAQLHAPFWGHASVDQMPWLSLPEPAAAAIEGMFPDIANMFRERFAAHLEREVMAAAMKLVPLAHQLLFPAPSQPTIIHGDFRLDNVLFDAKGGAWPLATLDWQTVTRGRGTLDAAYFLGSGLRAWDRADHETELLRIYHESLLGLGVQGYGWEQCWADYRKHSVNGLFMAVLSAVSVAQTERGDEMFLTMARRHAGQALALGGFSLWE
jgi:hypothetical protein